MGIYKYMRNVWKKPKDNLKEIYKERLIQFRKEPVTIRVAKPTRLDRARSLGYKAKQGVIVVRQRVKRGGHQKKHDLKGRKPRRNTMNISLRKNYQQIAEERAAKKFVNCEVLNSYEIARDGQHLWYEIIMIDRTHPSVWKDKDLLGIALQKGRVFRGVTSAGKRSRGLYNNGKGAEKARPSRRANLRRL